MSCCKIQLTKTLQTCDNWDDCSHDIEEVLLEMIAVTAMRKYKYGISTLPHFENYGSSTRGCSWFQLPIIPLTLLPLGDVAIILNACFFYSLYTFAAPCEMPLRGMPQYTYLTNEKSTLVQVMAYCHEAINYYSNQCWPRSMLTYWITRPQWVNSLRPSDTMWYNRTWSPLIHVMAWCLVAPSNYLNQCWLIVN